MACLVVALLSQLLLPAMHALVHYAERQGGRSHAHSHGARHGARELAWVIERAGGKAVTAASQAQKAKRLAAAAAAHQRSHHVGAAHSHHVDDASSQDPHAPSPLAPSRSHHHDGDQPGGPHGKRSLEHFTAFFLEATPPKLAVPFRRVSPAIVLLVEGRLALAPIPRAQPARGPPQLS